MTDDGKADVVRKFVRYESPSVHTERQLAEPRDARSIDGSLILLNDESGKSH